MKRRYEPPAVLQTYRDVSPEFAAAFARTDDAERLMAGAKAARDHGEELGRVAERLLELERHDELFNSTAQLVVAARKALRELRDRSPEHLSRGAAQYAQLHGWIVGEHPSDCALCGLELWLRAFE